MKTKLTYFLSIFSLMLLGFGSMAQPAIEVTDVYVYETPVASPPAEVPGDKVQPSQVVAIGLTLRNNGVDLLVGDTIRMGWSEVPNGSLVSVLTNDLLGGNTGNFIVIQSQTAPATAGPWEICIWTTYSSKGYTNSDPNVGNSCKDIEVEDGAVGISELAVNINKAYFNGNQLMLDLNSVKSQNLEIRLFSLGGQEVYNGTLNKGVNSETLSINTGDLKNGMYILSVYSADGNVVNQKLVK